MDSIWIMSYGPVLVDKQFIVDIPRLHPRVSLNENTLSNNVYNSLQYIYDICGIHYYMYTKYLNQTMGNMMIQYIQSINLAIHIVPIHKSYRVEGVYKPVEKYIKGYLFVKLYDHRLKYKQMIHCQCIYAIPENRVLIKIRII